MSTSYLTDNRELPRRRVRRFVYPERRTGFDRRVERQTVAGSIPAYLGDHQDTFLKVLVAINVFSLFDLLLTLNLMKSGLVFEGNPVIAALLRVSPVMALAFKMLVILLITMVFWRFRRYRFVLGAAASALVFFTALVGYQLSLHLWLL